jgi:two-component system cell cycle sensor histidine kinase/response regulator CckA
MGSSSKQHAANFEESSRLLAVKVASLILLTLVVFLVPLVWTVDSVLQERLVQQAQEALRQQDQLRYEGLRRDLQRAERSIERFARLLNTQLRTPHPEDETTFLTLFQQGVDGVWRSRRDTFEARNQAGMWAPTAAVASPADRSFFVQAKHLTDIYGSGAAEQLHANLWILPAGNGELVFWPDEPDFIYRATADQDYRPTEWFQSVQPPAYTSDRPRWTSTSFDPVPKVWMVSVITPYRQGGQWAGSVGHDVIIQDLFRGLHLGQPQNGSEIFLLDQQNRLLVASDHQAEIEQASGQLTPAQLNNPRCATLVQRVVEMAGPVGARRPALLDTGEALVTALPLEQPDWLLVNVMSRATARAMAEAPLRWLRWGLAISMGVLLAACGLVVSRDALRRLRAERELLGALAELEKLESFINRSPAVVFLWRAEPGWPVEFVSDNINQFGYEAADLMSGRVIWVNTLHPEDLPGLEAAVEKKREEGQREFSLTYRLYTADQETRWVETRILLINDGRGRLHQVQGIMLDITERQRIETALQAEQQRYQSLFTHAGASITYYDREGCLQMINPAACRQLQRDAAYLTGRRLEDFLPLDQAAATRQRLEEGLRQPATRTYEDEWDLPGGPCWFMSTFTTIHDAQGQALGVQVVAQDITERKQAELALRESQERYRLLFNAIGDALFVHLLNEQGQPDRFVEVNDEACRRLGYTREELLTMGPMDIVAHRNNEEKASIDEQLQITGRALFEHAHRTKSGQAIPVEIRCSRFELNGRPAVLSLVRDIRERRAAEAALAESRERYRLIVETAQEGVWMIDAKDRTTFVNQRMADMLGYSVEEMLGHTLFDHMDEKGRVIARANIERRKHGITESHDFCFKRKDGAEVWAIVSTNPLTDARGNYQGALALITDITERRRNEQDRRQLEVRIQQAQKLESLGILAAGIAHDFNNLLQTILGHAELALQDAPDNSPQKESLNEIFKAAQRAGVISTQMTAYVGQGSYQRSLCQLDTLLHELHPSLKDLVAQRALFTMEWDPGLPPALMDAAEFKQCVIHLITNAVESQGTPPGRIAIKAHYRPWRRQELQELLGAPELSEGSYLTLNVTDTGCGIDRATLAHLFEPFFTTKFPGRGLGLMHVLGFVRGHGGGIKVESMPGHGTTVTILLPEAPSEIPETPAMPWGWHGQGTILMVDDEASVLAVGRRLLTELGFSVLTAGEGQEALTVYREHRNDIRCVILDLVMPGLDGIQTLAALHELDPHLIVIIATAYPAQRAVEMLAGQVYGGLIHKPYSGAVLARQLQSLLG